MPLERLPAPLRARIEWTLARLPGIVVAGTIAMAATFVSEQHGGPVMLFALLLGMAFNFLSGEPTCAPGVGFTSRSILHFGVALLGARITVEEVVALGMSPLVVAATGVVATLVAGALLARLLGLGRDFGILTGGASAALAISSVLPRGAGGVSERDTIFTVLGVTTLSTIAMVLYPLLATAIGLDNLTAGIFLGATIHDVAQVVGAGYSLSVEAGDAATLTKLLRVAMLVPVVLAITLLLFRGTGEARGRAPLPLFLVAFIALVAINSLGWIPEAPRLLLVEVSRWALVAAIAALGIKTALKDLAAVGPRALVLLVAETASLALLVLALLALLG